jgi:hypothetical protein
MPKLKGALKKASVAIQTPAGKKSAARAIEPDDTTVILEDGSEVTVKTAVAAYVKALAASKAAKNEADGHAEVVRTYVGAVRDDNAEAGDYQKTYRVLGSKAAGTQFAVDVSQSDRFGVNKDVDWGTLRQLLGDSDFEKLFEEETVIQIKPEVLKNEKMRKKLSKVLFEALGTEGIKEYFLRETTFSVKPGMVEEQYTLEPELRTVLRENTKQVADSVKDATSNV